MDNLNEWMAPEVLWFVAGIILLLLEFAVPGLIVFFFGIGAVVTSICCMFFDISIGIQFLIFAVTSIASLFVLRSKFEKIFHGKSGGDSNEDDFDEYIGKKCKVVVPISPKVSGKVEFQGSQWNAEADEPIGTDEVVEIIRKDNITLIVKKL